MASEPAANFEPAVKTATAPEVDAATPPEADAATPRGGAAAPVFAEAAELSPPAQQRPKKTRGMGFRFRSPFVRKASDEWDRSPVGPFCFRSVALPRWWITSGIAPSVTR